ncbi:sodium:solute symporter [Panacibacter ginsenosidivorans]|uniref:Sodium:solute symporter n=1 Tax=Panacibacter ginsenosidivorans TaxID=1813871 RepID=A0A5B8VA08_9BACT|nr:sodium:solute symporter [Panacibacter ginsenosidivorans]QEC67763.1 sodium:solute symporter [Panacibacter ginsenosidivorans]
MSATFLFSFVIAYFLLLLGVAWYTSRNSNNDSFFIGNRSSNWMLVSFGMIGTSLSGVTFVSVPGTVGANAFGYFQVVIGYFIGYFVVAYVLLPLYYRLNLTSIYNYLLQRFGNTAYKTGAMFFILSRVLGATARLYLVINVLQLFILDNLHIPFPLTTFVILLMILLYTFEGGVKTIVFTDTLQTTFMLLGLIVCVFYIMYSLDLSFVSTLKLLSAQGYTKIINTDVNSAGFFLKQIIGGAFITIGMTGLDQEMMQKNISVKTLGGSQKNMVTFSFVLVVVNFLFLLLGGLLYLFASTNNIAIKGDDLFPTVALQYLPSFVSIIFIIGLISALFPSADGALTALTSSFCIDILGLKKRDDLDEKQRRTIRLKVHLTMAIIFFLCVMMFKWINDKSIINIILTVAGYTYGPLLALFAFGIFTKRKLPDNFAVIFVCLAAPLFCYFLSNNAVTWFNGYHIGVELLLINALVTIAGLYFISQPADKIAA